MRACASSNKARASTCSRPPCRFVRFAGQARAKIDAAETEAVRLRTLLQQLKARSKREHEQLRGEAERGRAQLQARALHFRTLSGGVLLIADVKSARHHLNIHGRCGLKCGKRVPGQTLTAGSARSPRTR
eukprot:2782547-Pleurochrysis_carterae.AAC.2